MKRQQTPARTDMKDTDTSYTTSLETITVNDVDFSLRTLSDRQQSTDQMDEADALGISSATWPMFGVVWPVARVLAQRMSAMNLEGKRVLEIGCGIGLASLVLHERGIDITASDYHPLAKNFLDRNVQDNNLPPIKYLDGNWETENPLLGTFDVIIGSDVLYEPAHVENVSAFIDRHSAPSSQVIIVDPNRGNRAKFTHAMLALGYSHDFERFNENDGEDDACKGRVLHYWRDTGVEE